MTNVDLSLAILDGDNAKNVVLEFGLKTLLFSGSTADFYASSINDRVQRLSLDAGSHNILVHGYRDGFAFPRIYKDFGVVGISDEDSDDRYWLLEVEKCSSHLPATERFENLVNSLGKINDELQFNNPGDYKLGRALIYQHRSSFEEHGILETITYIVDYAERYFLNLDLHPGNFMIDKTSKIVAIDPVYGPDPAVFNL